MSTTITNAFVNQFSSNVQMLSQQMGSLLRDSVSTESVTGEKSFHDQVGQAAAVAKTSRHADTPLMDTPHTRRMITMQEYEYADLIDDGDKVKMLIDPTSTYAKAAAAAMGRAIDDVIIAGLGGTSQTGKDGATGLALPSTQKIAHGSAGLTQAKLVSAKKLLDAKSVDPSIKRYIVVSPEQIEDLLNLTAVTSSDFNTVKALVQGEISEFLGFTFITSNRLGDDGTNRLCYAWAEDGCMLALNKDVTSRIEERADKSFATQVYYCASFGASRMEEEKVVEIACVE